MIAPHCCDEHVVQSVVVVIANGHAHTVTTQVEAGVRSDIAEMTLPIVVIQCQGRGLFAFGNVPRPVGGVDKEQVRGAIVVEVEERHAATHRFGQQLLAVSAVVVDEGDAGLFGDVCEPGDGNFLDVRFAGSGRVELGDLRLWRGRLRFEEKRDSANDRAHDQQHDERPAERATDDRVIAGREFLVFRVHLFLVVKQDLLEANRIIGSCPAKDLILFHF